MVLMSTNSDLHTKTDKQDIITYELHLFSIYTRSLKQSLKWLSPIIAKKSAWKSPVNTGFQFTTSNKITGSLSLNILNTLRLFVVKPDKKDEKWITNRFRHNFIYNVFILPSYIRQHLDLNPAMST